MFVDFSTLKKVLPYVVRARKPILLRAKHGVGKSEFVKSFDKLIPTMLYPNHDERKNAFKQWLPHGGLKDDVEYVFPVIDRRASQMADAGDLMGLPFLDDDVTAFKSMKWFHKACVQPCILLFDEIDRANQDVRQAIFQVNDSRMIGDAKLHPDTIVFGCINGGIGDTAYQIGDFDPAEMDRWTVFDVKPSVPDWLNWAKEKPVSPQIWDFIKQNNNWLEHGGEFEPNKVYPSRRSWSRLDDAVDAQLLDDSAEKETSILLFHLADGFVGHEAAVSFQDFCKNYKKQVTVEDIIVRGNFKIAKTLEINQHMALIDKFQEYDVFKKPMSEFDKDGAPTSNHKEMNNLAQYVLLVPHELAMKIWEVTTRLYPRNGVALHATVVNGRSISAYISELNGG